MCALIRVSGRGAEPEQTPCNLWKERRVLGLCWSWAFCLALLPVLCNRKPWVMMLGGFFSLCLLSEGFNG